MTALIVDGEIIGAQAGSKLIKNVVSMALRDPKFATVDHDVNVYIAQTVLTTRATLNTVIAIGRIDQNLERKTAPSFRFCFGPVVLVVMVAITLDLCVKLLALSDLPLFFSFVSLDLGAGHYFVRAIHFRAPLCLFLLTHFTEHRELNFTDGDLGFFHRVLVLDMDEADFAGCAQ